MLEWYTINVAGDSSTSLPTARHAPRRVLARWSHPSVRCHPRYEPGSDGILNLGMQCRDLRYYLPDALFLRTALRAAPIAAAGTRWRAGQQRRSRLHRAGGGGG